MKRIISTAFLLLGFLVFANAQDIIITKDSRRIEAKIVNVNRSTINYKEYNNLEGETKTILKSEIATVSYEDGTAEVYNAVGTPQAPRTDKKGPITCSEMEFATYKNGDLFYNDRVLSDKEVRNAMRNCNTELFKKYKSGQHRMVGGIVSTCVGLDLCVCGGVFMLYGSIFDSFDSDDEFDEDDEIDDVFYGLGIGFLTVGATATAIGIPLWVSGVNKKRNALQEFRDSYKDRTGSYNEPIHLDLTSHKNQIGLALKF